MMVKICGITNRDDGLAAIYQGAAALGFNFYPQSPRYLDPQRARDLVESLPPTVWMVGVFVNETRERVEEIVAEVGLDIVQLHGKETPDQYPEEVRVWKAIRVDADFSLDRWRDDPAEALLLDGAANGQTFDWSAAEGATRKIILAGGLGPDNVAEAIRRVRPWGVDACSRIESEPGKKDRNRMIQFIQAALAEKA